MVLKIYREDEKNCETETVLTIENLRGLCSTREDDGRTGLFIVFQSVDDGSRKTQPFKFNDDMWFSITDDE